MRKVTQSSSRIRIITLAVLILFLYAGAALRMMQFQVVQGEDFLETVKAGTTSKYTVQAARGDIEDRYGRKLATTKAGYNVVLDWSFVDRDHINQLILEMIQLFREEGVEWVNELPIRLENGGYVFEEERETEIERMRSNILRLASYATAENCVEKMFSRYDINNYPIYEKAEGEYAFVEDKDQKEEIAQLKADLGLSEKASANECMQQILEKEDDFYYYSDEDAFAIAAVRYTMERKEFSINNRYTFAEDISSELIVKVKELGYIWNGVTVEEIPTRVYLNEDIASHLIGYVGPIYAEEYAALKEQGYQMNDIIGKDGIEKALEDVLQGTDGTVEVLQDENGEIIATNVVEEAVAGNTVRLSIDSAFQKKVQDLLQEFVDEYNAKDQKYPCTGGAAVVIDVKTGELLACASCPNYTIEEFKTNYSELIQDTKKPTFNKAVQGLYRPGSSFKPIVATAGLMENLIERDTVINCTNPYMFFAPSYTPSCLQLYHSGNINVITALKYSCNIFFYDTGRRLGSEKLEYYANQMGLGVTTGLELSQPAGQVSSKALAEQLQLEGQGEGWHAGDILQAAIGQGLTVVTPISMASEAMTIANKGTRYETHLVNSLWDYEGNLISQTKPVVANEGFAITEEAYETVKDGMVAVSQTVASVRDWKYPVAMKTGSPQTNWAGDRVNSDFIAFAPADDPEIAISCIMEDGTNITGLLGKILTAYEESVAQAEKEATTQYPQEFGDIM